MDSIYITKEATCSNVKNDPFETVPPDPILSQSVLNSLSPKIKEIVQFVQYFLRREEEPVDDHELVQFVTTLRKFVQADKTAQDDKQNCIASNPASKKLVTKAKLVPQSTISESLTYKEQLVEKTGENETNTIPMDKATNAKIASPKADSITMKKARVARSRKETGNKHSHHHTRPKRSHESKDRRTSEIGKSSHRDLNQSKVKPIYIY